MVHVKPWNYARIAIPTLHDRPKDFDYLFTLAAQIVETSSARRNAELDFTGCKFLMQNAVAILGGLAKLRTVEALWFSDRTRSTSKCVAALERNQFLRFFGQPSREPIGGLAHLRSGLRRDECIAGVLERL